MHVYPQRMTNAGEIVEWTRGSLLTDYERRMSPALFQQFLESYRKGIIQSYGSESPVFFPFKRILLWAGKPELPADRAKPLECGSRSCRFLCRFAILSTSVNVAFARARN